MSPPGRRWHHQGPQIHPEFWGCRAGGLLQPSLGSARPCPLRLFMCGPGWRGDLPRLNIAAMLSSEFSPAGEFIFCKGCEENGLRTGVEMPGELRFPPRSVRAQQGQRVKTCPQCCLGMAEGNVRNVWRGWNCPLGLPGPGVGIPNVPMQGRDSLPPPETLPELASQGISS